MPAPKTFSGVSKKGNFQEALDNAIKAAQDSATGADRQVQWTLKKTSGRRGGITGSKELTVVISATIS